MAAPTITSRTPASGPVGTIITVTGSGFNTVTDFKVGTTSCPSFNVFDDNNAECEVPSTSAGLACVQAFNPDGFSPCIDPDNTFTVTDDQPAVSDVSPATGSTAGGYEVTITGLNFIDVEDVQVTNGGATSVDSFIVDSDTQIRAILPAHDPGVIQMLVFTLAGISGGFDNFEYTGLPPLDPGSACITVQVPTLLADGATADGNGIVYTVEAVDGWYDSIPMRSALLEAQPRGETIVVAHEGGRTIDLRITAHSAIAGEALGAILCFTATYTIKTAFRAVFVPISFRVVDAYADRTLLARRIGPIKESILGNSAAVTFSIPMLGEDPRRFAT